MIINSALVSAQSNDFLTKLDARFKEHVNKSPRTHIEAFFNQNKYAPGDSVFFSVRYLYENKSVVPGSDILYLDVVSSSLKVRHRIRFRVKDGVAYNQFRLEDDLEPGIYRFYIYSDWMKNFGVDAFFHYSVPITGNSKVHLTNDPIYELLIFPEGGNLINGIENYINIAGRPGEVLYVKDNKEVLLDSVKLNDLGIASLAFVPKQNQAYYAEFKEKKVDFPMGTNDGVAFHLNFKEEWFAETLLPPNSTWLNKTLYLVIVAEDVIVFKNKVKLSSEKVRISLPQFDNSNTLHYAYLINDLGEEVAQRLFVPINVEDQVKVNFKLLPEVRQRQSYTMGVGLSDFNSMPLEANFSISVTQKELFEYKSSTPTYLQRVGPAFEWATRNSISYAQYLNEFLATQRTNRFNWTSIYKNLEQPRQYNFRSEMAIRGRIISRTTRKPAPDSLHVVAYLQKNLIGYETFAMNGKFNLPLSFDFWNNDNAFMTLRYRNRNVDSEYEIQILEDSIIFADRWNAGILNEPDHYANYRAKQKLIEQSYFYFAKKSMDTPTESSPNNLLEDEFPEIDNAIKIGNYKVFPNMDDLLREVVTFVQLRRKGDDATVRLFFRYDKSLIFYKQDPLYIIDGVMTTDTKFFLSLTPENLISIKAINNPNKLGQLGALGQFGVVFVESKTGDLGNKLKSNLFPVTGLSKAREFTEATWIKSQPSNIPTLKSTLYWNPIAKSSSLFFETTFLVTDDIGVMNIVIQGITENGKMIYSETEFNVQKNPNRN